MKKVGVGFFSGYTPGKISTVPAQSGGGFYSNYNGHDGAENSTSQPGTELGPVAEMQRQILALYSAFRNSFDVVQWFKENKEPAVGSTEFRNGPYAFLQSLLNRYIDGASIHANQYNLMMPNAKEYTAPGKQSPASSFLQYLSMLHTIGPHTAQPDGDWGEYTNNALKAAWSIGFAMASIAGKLQVKDFPLKLNDLKMFSEQIPATAQGLDDVRKSEKAKEISDFLDKITKAVPAFINMMKDSAHGLGAYISGDKKFDVFNGTKQGLTAEEQKRASELSNQLIPGLDKLFSGLKYKDISTPQNFNAWLKMTGKYDGTRNYPDYLAELKRQLSLALEQAKAKKPTSQIVHEVPF